MEYKFAMHSAVKLREHPPGTGIIEDIHILGGVRVYAVRLSGESTLSYFTDRELRIKPNVDADYAPGVSAPLVPTSSSVAVTCQKPLDMKQNTSSVCAVATASSSTTPTTRVLRSSMQRNGKGSGSEQNVAGYEAIQKERNSNRQMLGKKRTKGVDKVADAVKSCRKNTKETSPDVTNGPYQASQGQVGSCVVRSNQQPNRIAPNTAPPNSDNNSQHANLFDVPLIDATMGPSAKLPKKRRSN